MDLHNTKGAKNFEPNNPCSPYFDAKRALAFQATKNANIDKKRDISIKHRVPNGVVIFCDLSNYQCLAEQYGDMACTNIVETLFVQFDDIATSLRLTPLKTNGDQYIVVGFVSEDEFADAVLYLATISAIEFALKARNLTSSHTLLVSSSCQLRVGIATGTLIAGPSKRALKGFDVWGATVNKAAMLEQFTAPSTIAICEKTHDVFATSPDRVEFLLTQNDDALRQDNNTVVSANSTNANESSPITCCTRALNFYKTKIQTKTTLLNAYIC